jgi:hypothetical protein
VVPNRWIDRFEQSINSNGSADAWLRVASGVSDEHELITYLYQDSQPLEQQNKELLRHLEKTAELLLDLVAGDALAEFADLPDRLRALTNRLRGPVRAGVHLDNECATFYTSICSILVDPKLGPRSSRAHSYSGLPTYNDCIQIIQSALDATDDAKPPIRETKLTEESLKKFLKRQRNRLDEYRSSFVIRD